ncbi:MAG: hypothetical protein RLZZ295_513 [Actinomycetota bacterium]|jgi:hypothetical protein
MHSQEAFDYNDRYGVTKSRSWIAVALITAVVGVGWITWAGLHHSNPAIRTQLITFVIDNDREVSVRYSVDRHSTNTSTVCTLIARDYDKNIVGQIDQEIPAGKAKVELVTVVPTRSEAVNADVSSCRAK